MASSKRKLATQITANVSLVDPKDVTKADGEDGYISACRVELQRGGTGWKAPHSELTLVDEYNIAEQAKKDLAKKNDRLQRTKMMEDMPEGMLTAEEISDLYKDMKVTSSLDDPVQQCEQEVFQNKYLQQAEALSKEAGN